MRIRDTNVYVGPSLFAHFPVIRHTLELGELEDWPTVKLPGSFVDSLLETLPGLRAHGCSYGEPGGFVRRMTEDEGTWLGHVLEHVAIELQNEAGLRVTFGKTRSTDEPGVYHVVYEYEERRVGLAAGELAIKLLHSLLPRDLRPADSVPADFDFVEEKERLIRFAQRRAFGPSTSALVRAAEERDIPWLRLNPYSLVQFGHGRYQRRIQATVTSETRHIAVDIASDKELTNEILRDLGLPVPQQRPVHGPRDAARAARRIGYPVVVKPLNANHGRGVSLNLTDDEHVEVAFAKAREHSRTVLVETFIDGLDHRLLVIDGELIAAAKRVPGHVVGDGRGTIEELVELVNQDPRRGIGHEKVLTRIELDHQALRLLDLMGYTPATVPAEGETVYLRSTGNLSTGGTAVDVTDVVHPDVRDMAVRAAAAVGLDVAGVDFLTSDVTKSYHEIGGAICEVNAAPGFRMHTAPTEGSPRDVAGPVMDMLFPPASLRRIPIASITGTNGKTTTTRMLAHLFKMAGRRVGLATTDGVYMDGVRTVAGDMTGPTSARMVLRDPTVDVAVLETARGGLLRAGMGYRKCDVGVVLNVASDHLGLRGVQTLEELAEVKRIVVEVATDAAVLNADDPLCLRMAAHTEASHVCYVTANPEHQLVGEHIRAGGRAVVLEKGINGHMITLYENGAHLPVLWTHLIPATLEGRAMHNVQNAMCAAAAGYSMGLGLEDIRHGLRTFDASFFQAPGRTNVFDDHPFKVILDYGHNPAAVQAMCDLVGRIPTEGRRLVVLAAPGDRRDEDIREIGRIAAGRFDHYVCRRDDALRGRGPEEVPAMLREELLAAGVADEAVEIVPDEAAAVRHALELAQPGDLLLVFGDAVARTWTQIVQFDPSGAERPAGAAKSVRADDSDDLPVVTDAAQVAVDLADAGWIRDERGVLLAPEEAD
ncbi:MAG: cyanophycin synthetase [Gemmatimonadota bacterium]